MCVLLVVKVGSTFSALAAERGDFKDWIRWGMGRAGAEARVVDVPGGGILPPPADLAGIVVSGSHALVQARGVE